MRCSAGDGGQYGTSGPLVAVVATIVAIVVVVGAMSDVVRSWNASREEERRRKRKLS
jgi:hypothetical protein